LGRKADFDEHMNERGGITFREPSAPARLLEEGVDLSEGNGREESI